MKSTNRKLISATRKELEYQLKVKEGTLPDDWYGHVFINSPAGTVNSNGLPYPKGSSEQGSPIMNGDGYVFRFDLEPDRVKVKTALMKPPCYYADEATKHGNPNGYDKLLFAFNNCGLSRLSLALGARNELNTAISPIKFKGDQYARMIACYDAGKPWEFDPASLKLRTAIGNNNEYVYATPEKVFPFPVIQTTAHPVFDPRTQELFIVNFYHSLHQNKAYEAAIKILEHDVHKSEDFLEDLVKDSWHKLSHTHIIKEIDHLLGIHTDTNDHKHHSLKWLKNMIHVHHKTEKDSTKDSNDVFILRHTGQEGPMDKWKVVDENNQEINIEQCMHQVAFTEDYLILADATFKVSLDLMFNNPFKSKRLNSWLRVLLTKKQLPYLKLYLIKRSELDPNSSTVTAKALPQPIPLEAVHFSADYLNPKGEITLHLAHNSAACLAEWVREYDYLAYDHKKKVEPEVIGLISVGCMDIGRIGKVVVDAKSGDLVSQDYIMEKGNTKNTDQIGVHTWGVGLYTYRGIVEAGEIPDSIEYNYWSSYGLDPRLHTKFIFDLYYQYKNRVIDQSEMLKLNKEGVPFVLSRQNVSTMELEDYFQFSKNVILKSVQFVPRTKDAPRVTDHKQKDGYIFTSVLVNYPENNEDNYQCEIWVFKAWDLASGPVCTLHHPDLDYAFTLHSVWVDKVGKNDENPYYIDPKDDYNPLIQNLYIKERRKEVQDLFDKHVYPNFQSPEA